MRYSLPLKRREVVLIAAFWTLYGLLTGAGRLVDPAMAIPEPRLATVALLSFTESLSWALLTPFVFWLASQWESDGVSRTRHVVMYVAVGIVIALVLSLFGAALHGVLFARTMSATGLAHSRPFWFVFLNGFVIYLAVLAVGHARVYSSQYQERRAQATRLQAELAQVQLDALRRQLDPHFLFNTLNAVSTLVERDPRGVRRMIARLSELLRHSLEGADVPEIPLRQELALLECYLDIMQVRFQGRLSIEMHVDGRTLDCLVPTLILQPLVENAIRHGVERIREIGHIEIWSVVDGETVTLRVRDNGPGLAEGTPRWGVGLRNTVARLDRLYGAQPRLFLQPAVGGGTVAEVRLPFRPRSERGAEGIAADSAEVVRVR
jgi:two-component system LytT family sensor kinase